MKKSVLKRYLPLMAALVLVSACSTKTNDDPLEGYNRGMFAVNEAVDTVLIEPVARGYRFIAPKPIRWRIGNMADNLGEPLSMMNAFLQGNFTQGMTNFWRFIINSTIGIAGMHDVAATAGLAAHEEDFGQTFAVWGAGSGPYIVLPILGPSNLRDTTGRIADWFADPINVAVNDHNTSLWLALSEGLVTRERLIDPIDDIYASSLDPYASFKSIYEQRREAEINDIYTDKPKLN